MVVNNHHGLATASNRDRPASRCRVSISRFSTSICGRSPPARRASSRSVARPRRCSPSPATGMRIRPHLTERLVRHRRHDAAGRRRHFFFAGRNDDIITSAGYRIGPFDVESVIIEHPAVAEVAVVGKPDPERTEIVKAFVVLRKGFDAERRAGGRVAAARAQTPVAARLSARDRSSSTNCRRRRAARCSGSCSVAWDKGAARTWAD